MDDSSLPQKQYWLSSLATIFFVFLLVSTFLYFFVFSRSNTLIEYSTSPLPSPLSSEAVQVLGDQDIPEVPLFSWIAFEASELAITFVYPTTFSIKEENWECASCPNIVLENGDESIFFGTVAAPATSTACERITKETHQVIEDFEVEVQEYEIVSDLDECQQSELELAGLKALFTYGKKNYFIDYLFENKNKDEAVVVFAQLLSSLRVADNTAP